MSRTDALVLMVEAQEADQVQFVKEVYSKYEKTEPLQFVPLILVQTKMDPDGVGTLQRSETGQRLASELSISQYKEISAKTEISDTIESIMKVLAEPKKALSKDKLKQALEMDSGHTLLNMFNGGATSDDDQSQTTIVIVLGFLASAAFGLGYLYKKHYL